MKQNGLVLITTVSVAYTGHPDCNLWVIIYVPAESMLIEVHELYELICPSGVDQV